MSTTTYAVQDSVTMLRRNLTHMQRYPSLTLMLIGQPVHQWLGQRGLLAFAALLAAGAIAFAWRARRAARSP